MLKVYSGIAPTNNPSKLNWLHMALCQMGYGHPGILSTSFQPIEISHYESRLLHEASGGRAISFNHQEASWVVHMKNIITRFRILRAPITDNRTQFNNTKFREFCRSYEIKLRFNSIAPPQTNSLTEVINQAIIKGLKKRVIEAKSTCADELPSILWASRTTHKIDLRESPFGL